MRIRKSPNLYFFHNTIKYTMKGNTFFHNDFLAYGTRKTVTKLGNVHHFHPLPLFTLFDVQNIFHAVIEVPRWTSAKMEVRVINNVFSMFSYISEYQCFGVCDSTTCNILFRKGFLVL